MRVFISFDYENDRKYRYLLAALAANSNIDFTFEDTTSKEINSENVGRVKAVLTRKINESDITLVIVGKEANKLHQDAGLIGYKNWQNFEIAKSVEAGNKIVGVKLDRTYESPEELLGHCDAWAYSFELASITKALNQV
ncbi:MAG TPA: TIR domain-containing protein [Candidatus Prevotella avicola]|uniref:TIR domain-containing protein n=1 Tax=Candidatus Prevotella avicola TaxID=2838738 RepID=A0A9D2FXQ5_9BACT|nr:TIR domain-containing protein [Candidatus Prevotella avicola]